MKNWKTLIFLHLILLMYSCSGVFSKLAGLQELFSFRFFVYYGMVLLILFLYAILWQKVIKVMPLTTAFANKAITVIWGILFGILLFHESLTAGKVIGAVLIMIGIVLYTRAGKPEEENHG